MNKVAVRSRVSPRVCSAPPAHFSVGRPPHPSLHPMCYSPLRPAPGRSFILLQFTTEKIQTNIS